MALIKMELKIDFLLPYINKMHSFMFKKYLKIKTLNVKINNNHITNVSILNKLVVSLVLTSIISGNPDLTGYIITLIINDNAKSSNRFHWETLPRYMQRLWLKK